MCECHQINNIKGQNAILAMKEASRIAAENGISEMTLDEINAEIAEVRKQQSGES